VRQARNGATLKLPLLGLVSLGLLNFWKFSEITHFACIVLRFACHSSCYLGNMHNIRPSVLAGWVFSGLLSVASGAYAQNSIIALNAGYIGNGMTVVKIGLAQPLVNLPHTEFIISSPPRIVLEFSDTENGLGESVLEFTEGGLHSANIVQVEGRTRFVVYLSRMFPYNIRINGSSLLIVLQGDAADMDVNRSASRLANAEQDTQGHTHGSDDADAMKQIGGEVYETLHDDARLKSKQDVPVTTEENAGQPTETGVAETRIIAAYAAQFDDLFAPDLDILTIQPARPDTDWLFAHRRNEDFSPSFSGDATSAMPRLSNKPQLPIVAKPRKEVIWLTNERWQIASDGALFSPILRFEAKGERFDIKPRRRSIWFGWRETFP